MTRKDELQEPVEFGNNSSLTGKQRLPPGFAGITHLLHINYIRKLQFMSLRISD
jgi:hypothetical protein